MILNSIIPILLIICYGCLIRVIVRTVLPAQDKGNKDTPMEKKTKSDIVGKSRYMPLQEASCKTDETPPQAPGNESGNETEVDYIVDNDEPEELEEDDPEDGAAQNMLASGVSFEGLKESIKTADEYENSASQQRRKAGETLLEIHKTDMLEQLVSGKPNRAEALSTLLTDAISAYHKNLDERSGIKNKGNNSIEFVNDSIAYTVFLFS